MPYLGKTPSQATRQRYYLTASGGETSVSGTMTVGGTLTFTDGEFVDVSVNGVALVAGTDYNTNTANTIAGLSALTANDQVEIVVYDTFSVFSGDVDSNLSVGGNLSVTGTTALTGNATAAGTLDVTGAITSSAGATITTADNTAQLTLKSTDADSNVGPVLDLVRDSASPADGDAVGQIKYIADNDAGEATTYSSAFTTLRDASNGAEDGQVLNYVITGGSLVDHLRMGRGSANGQSEVVINEGSADIDFRVEGNGNANAFFVQGSDDFIGIGTGTPKKKLHIQDTTSDGIIILDRNDTSTDHQICFAHNYQSGGQSGGNYYAIGVDDSENTLVFAFDANSQASLASDAKMILNSSGTLLVGTTTTAVNSSSSAAGFSIQAEGILAVARSGGDVASFNRQTNDGTVVQIHQAGTVEGTISVSGSTVSYNGGHLSRWSQATDGNRIDGLVKGTIMTNLDQMAEWTKDGVTEDNEQLNCMAVSSVEGDANVAGVFVNWDDDDKDYTADMNVAMTGDMVIRIAKDTTVARGDLLMSAGDGTAKPQGDDIVRSKTIAKVTSTNKSHTYDDGSYLVPCVLMAC